MSPVEFDWIFRSPQCLCYTFLRSVEVGKTTLNTLLNTILLWRKP